ncbi:MAG: hypothetical protein GX194_06460 [Clostridium sp.]|nr:hypothetical protein [Clostridium sp.]
MSNMDKIYVELVVPATGKKYEFIIPAVMKIGIVADLMAQAVSEIEGIDYDKNNLMLCLMDKKEILSEDITVEKAGVTDGSQLMMI